MKITVNGTTLNVVKCEEVFDYESHALAVTVSKTEIDCNALNALVFGNKGEITKEDDDGKKKIYAGFTTDADISIMAEVYIVKFYAVPSSEKKIIDLEMAVAEKETAIADLEAANARLVADIENALAEGVSEV